MKGFRARLCFRKQAGSSIIEFAFIAFLLCLVLLAGIELDRMVLVYTTVSNSARVGERYAIVHGSSRTGAGVDGPSGPGATAEVETVVRNFASAGLLDTHSLNISVTYPVGNDPGQLVIVSVAYPYDPFTLLPLRVNLRCATRGIIAF